MKLLIAVEIKLALLHRCPQCLATLVRPFKFSPLRVWVRPFEFMEIEGRFRKSMDQIAPGEALSPQVPPDLGEISPEYPQAPLAHLQSRSATHARAARSGRDRTIPHGRARLAQLAPSAAGRRRRGWRVACPRRGLEGNFESGSAWRNGVQVGSREVVWCPRRGGGTTTAQRGHSSGYGRSPWQGWRKCGCFYYCHLFSSWARMVYDFLQLGTSDATVKKKTHSRV